MQSIAIGSLFIWGVAGLALLLGIVLLVIARRGRRVGSTRFCAKCKYNLTGITADRCPECGGSLDDPAAVLLGERVTRRRLFVAGALAALLGSGLLTALGVGVVHNINWYAHLPTWWIIGDLEDADQATTKRAIKELAVRSAADRLGTDHRDRLVRFCLAEQVSETTRGSIATTATNILGDLHKRGLLTEQERADFLSHIAFVGLRVRARINAGDPASATVVYMPRGGNTGLFCIGVYRNWVLDGTRQLDHEGGWESTGGIGARGWSGVDLPELKPGRHELTCEVTQHIYEGGPKSGSSLSGYGGSPSKIKPGAIFETTRTLHAVFEVMPEGAADVVRMRSSAAIDAAIRGAVTVERMRLRGARLSGAIIFHNPRPIDLALSVFVEIDGRETFLQNVDRLAATAKTGQHATTFGREWLGDLPDTVTVILRGSRDAALETPDMFDIWEGELRFENLPVEQVLTPTTMPAIDPHTDSPNDGG